MAFVVVAIDSPTLSATAVAKGNRPSGRNSYSTRRGRYHGSPSRGRGSGSRGHRQQRAAPITGDVNSVYYYKCGYPNHKANVCEASPSASTAQVFTAFQILDQTDTNWYPGTGVCHHMTSDSSLPEDQ